jgi:hypothetical protein
VLTLDIFMKTYMDAPIQHADASGASNSNPCWLSNIDSSQSPILDRLGLASDQWLTLTTEFEKHFCYAAGAELMMNEFKRHTNHKRLRGMGTARALLKRA